jgi:hypothetical protein
VQRGKNPRQQLGEALALRCRALRQRHRGAQAADSGACGLRTPRRHAHKSRAEQSARACRRRTWRRGWPCVDGA